MYNVSDKYKAAMKRPVQRFRLTGKIGGIDFTDKDILKDSMSLTNQCSGSENVGLQGYDLVTRLGSTLDFTAQTAALVHTEAIELVRDNFGFDLASGVTEAKLDPEAEHYYLEIRPIASD